MYCTVVILASHGIRYTAHPMWEEVKSESIMALPTVPQKKLSFFFIYVYKRKVSVYMFTKVREYHGLTHGTSNPFFLNLNLFFKVGMYRYTCKSESIIVLPTVP